MSVILIMSIIKIAQEKNIEKYESDANLDVFPIKHWDMKILIIIYEQELDTKCDSLKK